MKKFLKNLFDSYHLLYKLASYYPPTLCKLRLEQSISFKENCCDLFLTYTVFVIILYLCSILTTTSVIQCHTTSGSTYNERVTTTKSKYQLYNCTQVNATSKTTEIVILWRASNQDSDKNILTEKLSHGTDLWTVYQQSCRR